MQHDPVTLKYLVQHAWGCGNSYLAAIWKQQKQQAMAASCIDGGFEPLLLLAPPPQGDEMGLSEPNSVIDNYQLAERKYTPAFLYAVNKCHLQAKNNMDTVDKALYTKRYNAGKQKFERLDAGKRAIREAKH